MSQTQPTVRLPNLVTHHHLGIEDTDRVLVNIKTAWVVHFSKKNPLKLIYRNKIFIHKTIDQPKARSVYWFTHRQTIKHMFIICLWVHLSIQGANPITQQQQSILECSQNCWSSFYSLHFHNLINSAVVAEFQRAPLRAVVGQWMKQKKTILTRLRLWKNPKTIAKSTS